MEITDPEYRAVLDRCRDLPPPKADYRVHDYVENLLLTVIDYQLQTKTVERAIQHYKSKARDAVHDYNSLTLFLQKHPNTADGNRAAAIELWGYRYWNRVELLRRLLAHFESVGVTSQSALEDWARKTTYPEFAGKVSGIGLAIFNWLVMRQGIETVKPDIWVHRFLKSVLRYPVSDSDAVAILQRAAKDLAIPAYNLDWRIWEFQRGANLTQVEENSVGSGRDKEDMDLNTVNSAVGIGAGVVGTAAGVITIVQFVKKSSGAQEKRTLTPEEDRQPASPARRLKDSALSPKPVSTFPEAKTDPAPPTGVSQFANDDEGYIKWLVDHPDGLVVNSFAKPADRPKYMVLHRATCRHISAYSTKAGEGAFTANGYIKACAETKPLLTEWAKVNGRPDGTFSSECKICKPK